MITNSPLVNPPQEPVVPPKESLNKLTLLLYVVFLIALIITIIVVSWYFITKDSGGKGPNGGANGTQRVMSSVTKGSVLLNKLDVGEPSSIPFGVELYLNGKVQRASEFSNCTVAELAENGKYLVTRCQDAASDATLWEYNSSSDTFLRVGDYDLSVKQEGGKPNLTVNTVPSVVVTNDGQYIAYTSLNGSATPQDVYLAIISVANNNMVQIKLEESEYSCGAYNCPSKPVISPDNKYVAVQRLTNQEITIYTIEGEYAKTIRTHLSSEAPTPGSGAWSIILDYKWEGNKLLFSYIDALPEDVKSVLIAP